MKKRIANIIWNNRNKWYYCWLWLMFPHYRTYILKDYNLTRQDFKNIWTTNEYKHKLNPFKK